MSLASAHDRVAMRWVPAPPAVALFVFLVFGLCLILNSEVTADGSWYWYSYFLNHGRHLYRDLHVPLQPFFFLENQLFQKALGQSWVLSLILPTAHLVLLALGYALLADASRWGPIAKAVVFTSAIATAIGWEFYLFDDYRSITDIISVYVVLTLVAVIDRHSPRALPLGYATVLGVLCGISFTTLANDGAMLFISVVFIVFFSFSDRRTTSLTFLCVAAVVSVFAVVSLTGDPFGTYFHYTLQVGAAIKGGTSQLAAAPFMLVADLAEAVVGHVAMAVGATTTLVALVPVLLVFLIRRLRAAEARVMIALLISAIGIVLTIGGILALILTRLAPSLVLACLAPYLMIGMYALGVYGGLKLLGILKPGNRRVVLLVIPLCALAAASMSSGGKHDGEFGPIGLALAVCALAFDPQSIQAPWRLYAFSLAALVGVSVLIGKIERPLKWEYYVAPPMFLDRELIYHPLYGPMVVDYHARAFFETVCKALSSDKGDRELLSIPYSYGNYYCGVPPWRGYVQTFFDTSSSGTIRTMVEELETRPPTWIIYQRQIVYLHLNEIFFNHGHALPQRELDKLIEQRVSGGEWTVVVKWRERMGDYWALIRTSPVQTNSQPAVRADASATPTSQPGDHRSGRELVALAVEGR